MTTIFLVYEDDHGSALTGDVLSKLNEAWLSTPYCIWTRNCEYMQRFCCFVVHREVQCQTWDSVRIQRCKPVSNFSTPLYLLCDQLDVNTVEIICRTLSYPRRVFITLRFKWKRVRGAWYQLTHLRISQEMAKNSNCWLSYERLSTLAQSSTRTYRSYMTNNGLCTVSSFSKHFVGQVMWSRSEK
jgi:hypothetical protein